MEFQENISLAEYTTMRVGGPARYLVEVRSKGDLLEALDFARDKNLDWFVLGEGADTVFSDKGFDGLIILNRIKGLESKKQDGDFILKAGAGENWDDLVKKSVELGLTGMEALSLIPGSVGAGPVHNIGAYGQEISGVLDSLEAYDNREGGFVSLGKEECGLGYRTSIFKEDNSAYENQRYIIVEVSFRLKRGSMSPPFYKDIEDYFKKNNIHSYSPETIRQAVIEIRTHKLPDPKKVATAGSFFRNPVVSKDEFERILRTVPEINEAKEGWSQPPYWLLPNGEVKVSAGRMIELAGYNGHEDPKRGMALWPTQNLTIVNKSAKSAEDVISFKNEIKQRVRDKFGVTLEEEVRVVE